MFEKLKKRWQIESNFQLIMILIVFSITGSASAWVSKPFVEFFGLSDQMMPKWIFTILRLILIFPIYNVLLIIIGTGLMATAITSCFDAAGLVTGGFSGISILVKAGTKSLYGNGIPLWVTNLVLNIPVFLLAAKIKGIAFVKKALLAGKNVCTSI